jgi:phage terminase large subunit
VTRDEVASLRAAALTRWQDPALFALEVLRTKTWARQREILQAVPAHPRVAVRSGHKIGKSSAVTILGLWWALTKPRARVIITAPSYRQVEGVLWKELTRLYRNAAWPIGGNLHMKPEGGLQFPDGSEIIGFSTNEPERMAGFSGPNMLFIVDEASGIDPKIFEAIDGNRAGGAKIVLISNPTQTSGVFHDAFQSDSSDWHTIHVSSRECAELATAELGHGTGLATLEWCDQCLREWGEEDPRYQVRVLGNFPSQAENAMIPVGIVESAKARWGEPPQDGPLQFGVDVARFGTDYSSVVWSRGNWASMPTRFKGLDNVELAGQVIRLIAETRLGDEPVTVCVDATNNAGVADVIRHSDLYNVEIIDVVASESARRSGNARLRDDVWVCLRDWLRTGAIPNDRKLCADLTAPKYTFDQKGKMKVESKIDLRKRIGRSTDDADALGLAVYRPPMISTYRQVFSERYDFEPNTTW